MSLPQQLQFLEVILPTWSYKIAQKLHLLWLEKKQEKT